jgi:hypothetical protein
MVSQLLKYLLTKAHQVTHLLLFLAHKIQQRVSKKIENFDSWKSKVTDIAASDFETANFTKPDQSGEQQ